MQGAVAAFTDKPIDVVDSAFRSGYFNLGSASTLDAGVDDREVFFVHGQNIVMLVCIVKRDSPDFGGVFCQ